MTTLDPALTRSVGSSVGRLEGDLKVTGQARYTAEVPLDGLVHASMAQSTITRGRVTSIDVDAALAMPGVLTVLTHDTAPRLGDTGDPELRLLQDDRVHYRGQVVAVVVADTPEQARAAADALPVEYATEDHDVVLTEGHRNTVEPGSNGEAPEDWEKGDVEAALAAAPVVVDATWSTPAEHNNPMEPHATVATWDGDRLTVHDSNQGAASVARSLTALFTLEQGAVRVLSEHVGGGFGAKGGTRPPVVLAALAARLVGRPVRLVTTRQQQFAFVGYRSPTIQRVRLGASPDGVLTAVDHLATTQTSTVKDFAERATGPSTVLYRTPNLRVRQRVVRLDVPTPRWMRAPGEAPGSFALESAMDELAHACGVDPVELRLRNDADTEPKSGQPFSSRNLAACLREGATIFGWGDRDPAPRSRQDGRWLVGTGVAAATFGAFSVPSSATAVAHPDGSFSVRIAASDIGQGARTVLAQIAADELRVPIERVAVHIGDSAHGPAMIAGGSAGTSSWSWAVVKACAALLDRTAGATPDADVSVTENTGADIKRQEKFSRHSFGAQFAHVLVDPDTGEVRVPRLVGVFAAGRIVNPTTARAQLVGGMTWGLSMALHEESIMDTRHGDYVNRDFAGYHIASNADVASVEASWVDDEDQHLGPLGAKGIGEVGIVGTAAAIANAVWHATGVRFRDLPLRPDRVLQALASSHAE